MIRVWFCSKDYLDLGFDRYEVKMQNGLECGGAYIKLFTKGEGEFNPEELHDKTPYTVMFGPDRCGSTNKV